MFIILKHLVKDPVNNMKYCYLKIQMKPNDSTTEFILTPINELSP